MLRQSFRQFQNDRMLPALKAKQQELRQERDAVLLTMSPKEQRLVLAHSRLISCFSLSLSLLPSPIMIRRPNTIIWSHKLQNKKKKSAVSLTNHSTPFPIYSLVALSEWETGTMTGVGVSSSIFRNESRRRNQSTLYAFLLKHEESVSSYLSGHLSWLLRSTTWSTSCFAAIRRLSSLLLLNLVRGFLHLVPPRRCWSYQSSYICSMEFLLWGCIYQRWNFSSSRISGLTSGSAFSWKLGFGSPHSYWDREAIPWWTASPWSYWGYERTSVTGSFHLTRDRSRIPRSPKSFDKSRYWRTNFSRTKNSTPRKRRASLRSSQRSSNSKPSWKRSENVFAVATKLF